MVSVRRLTPGGTSSHTVDPGRPPPASVSDSPGEERVRVWGPSEVVAIHPTPVFGGVLQSPEEDPLHLAFPGAAAPEAVCGNPQGGGRRLSKVTPPATWQHGCPAGLSWGRESVAEYLHRKGRRA